MVSFIGDIGVLFLVLVFICYIIKLLRQPIIIGYVLSGAIFSWVILKNSPSNAKIVLLSELGITLLLFLIGLEFDFKSFKFIGKDILITTLGQSVIFFALSFALSKYFGFSNLESAYISVLFMFSSTLLVAKWIEDKKETQTLYGRLVLGTLVVQDLIAIIMFVILGSLNQQSSESVWLLPLGGIAILVIAYLLSKYLLNLLIKFMLRYPEMVFIFGLGICFLFVELARLFGYSETIGAFIGGIVLANTMYKSDLHGRLKPLVIFFNMLFFVGLGFQLQFDFRPELIIFAVLLLVLCFFFKPAIIYLTLRLRGYDSKTSIKSSIALAQFSEFGIITLTMGLAAGVVAPELGPMAALLLIITMIVSSYFIRYNDLLANFFQKYLYRLDKYFKPRKEATENVDLEKYDLLFIGYPSLEKNLIEKFEGSGHRILVIENDPQKIELLKKERINYVYNSITNLYFLESLDLKSIKLLISSITNVDDNLMMLKKLKADSPEANSIFSARSLKDSLTLYDAGADYVICSAEIKEHQFSLLLEDYSQDINRLIEKKVLEMNRLKEKNLKMESYNKFYEWDEFTRRLNALKKLKNIRINTKKEPEEIDDRKSLKFEFEGLKK